MIVRILTGTLSTMDIFLRIATLILHVIRFGYWIIAEKKTNQEKAKSGKPSLFSFVKRLGAILVGIVMSFQLLGLQILPFQNTSVIQITGFLLVVIGISVTMAARRELGSNWAHAAEFQIRKNHTLVTHGVYTYIRHPLYTGMFLAVLGAEIVAGSYLFIPFFILAAIYFFIQAREEEKILLERFGTEYKSYMKRSAMFLPFIW